MHTEYTNVEELRRDPIYDGVDIIPIDTPPYALLFLEPQTRTRCSICLPLIFSCADRNKVSTRACACRTVISHRRLRHRRRSRRHCCHHRHRRRPCRPRRRPGRHRPRRHHRQVDRRFGSAWTAAQFPLDSTHRSHTIPTTTATTADPARNSVRVKKVKTAQIVAFDSFRIPRQARQAHRPRLYRHRRPLVRKTLF